MFAPNKITRALSVTGLSTASAIGHLHSLHYHWGLLDQYDRIVSLARAKSELEQALAAVVAAEQEIAPTAKSEPSNVVQIGDHSPEPINHRNSCDAPHLGGDAA